ncbi:MAG TPA: ABC transporter permease subunit [Vicinamibacterales bacterium]|jgi:ABC-type transport system involved in multi-copper enzyme maturation permease subunit|nr:ABC transporter permease subunit [Vicinamibacterales bacterium]
MNAARCVAVAVFRESVRDKVFYNLVLFAVLLIAASILIGQLTAGQDVKIIKDLGLAATSLFGLFIAVFVGTSLVSKEVDRRSIYPLLAKPVRRSEFIVGKYLGLLLTLLVNVVVMTIALYAVLFLLARGVPENIQAVWDTPAMDPAMLKAIAMIFVDLALVTALAVFFSSYSSPMLSAVFTLAVYVIGQFNGDLQHFDTIVKSPAAAVIGKACYYLLPDFSRFDIKLAVVHGLPVSMAYVASSTAYGAAYIAALIFGAIVIFSRRDFK